MTIDQAKLCFIYSLDDRYQALQKTFQLSRYDLHTIQQTVSDYSNQNLTNKIANGIKAVLASTPWETCKLLLATRYLKVIDTSFDDSTDASILRQRAENVAEFLLRFFVIQCGGAKACGIVSELSTDHDLLNQIPFEELLERSAFGDGQTLPLLSFPLLMKRYRQAYEAYDKDVDTFRVLMNSPRVKTLIHWSEGIDALGAMWLTKDDQRERAGLGPGFLKTAMIVLETAQKTLGYMRKAMHVQDEGEHSVCYLSNCLRVLRNHHKLFNELTVIVTT